jgi:hypothetical protein
MAARRFVMPFQTAHGVDGEFLPGAKLWFYESGSTTPLQTYADEDLSIENANPVVADSAGRFSNIWLRPLNYKVVLTDAGDGGADLEDHIQIWTADPVIGGTVEEEEGTVITQSKQVFVDGVDYTAGTTTTLTITETPIPSSGDALTIYFDGDHQQGTEWSYNTTTGVVTFDVAIPANVEQVEAVWVEPLGIGTPAAGTVNASKIDAADAANIRNVLGLGALAILDALSAADISYDNATSGLTATDVQAAIDELENEIDAVSTGEAANVWLSFNGSGTVAINDDVGVDSVTDNGTGNYTVNFTTNFDNINYSLVSSARRGTPGDTTYPFTPIAKNISSTNIVSQDNNGTNYDTTVGDLAIFGGISA